MVFAIDTCLLDLVNVLLLVVLVICSWSLLAMCFLFAVCGVGHVFLVVLVVVAKLLAQP